MKSSIITQNDILAQVIHSNHTVLTVLDRMGIKLGFGNKSIEEVAKENGINPQGLVLVLNLFCNHQFVLKKITDFAIIPDLLRYLKRSHADFLSEQIPSIQENIKQLVRQLHDSKAEMVESFYSNYIQEVTEHIEYENETVFPYIDEMYDAYRNGRDPGALVEEYNIKIYGEHHDDIEDELSDLKNILIRHLPQVETGNLRMTVLQQLFELESDLYSHTRIEDEVLIPLVRKLEKGLLAPATDN